MKKILTICAFIILMIVLTNPVIAAETSNSVKVKLNGQIIQFPDQQPLLDNNRILIPLRYIVEALRCNMSWDENTQTAIIDQNGTEISITIGSTSPKVNNQIRTLDVPAQLVGDRVMVPVRFISEVLGAQVDWNNAEQTVEIYLTPNYLPKELSDFKTLNNRYNEEQLVRALATSAVYDRLNGLPYDTFMLKIFPEPYVERTKNALYIWWRIASKEDALNTIKWLKEEGHRKEYDNLAKLFSNLTEEQYNKALEQYTYDKDLTNKITFIKQHHQQLEGKSIIGWDFCRMAGIAHDCYIAGYLSKDEAMNEIFYAAKITQKTFTSWEDMANNHLLGREYWSGAHDERYSEAVKWLLTNRESPWVKYKWDLSL